ncbi:MAG: hypothetical protein Q9180_002085 [Flavoplaca navasiana]
MFTKYRGTDARSSSSESSTSDNSSTGSISDSRPNNSNVRSSPYAGPSFRELRSGRRIAGYYREIDWDINTSSAGSPSSGKNPDSNPARRRSISSLSSSTSSCDEDTAVASTSHRDCSYHSLPSTSTNYNPHGPSSPSTTSGSVSSDTNPNVTYDHHTGGVDPAGNGQQGDAPSYPGDSSPSDSSSSRSSSSSSFTSTDSQSDSDDEDDDGPGLASLDILGIHQQYNSFENLKKLAKDQKEGLGQLQNTLTELQYTAERAFEDVRKNFEEQDKTTKKLQAKEEKIERSRNEQLAAIGPLKRKLLQMTAYVSTEEKRLRKS